MAFFKGEKKRWKLLILNIGAILNGLEVFLLVFVRMTGLFVIAPIFGRRNVPSYFKIGLSFMLALILSNAMSFETPVYADSIYGYGFLVIKEFLVGIIIGYVAYLVFSAVYIAGQIIDMQVGFGMVNVMDPVNSIQVPISANFYYIIAMVIFLIADGHHMLIKALYASFNAIPPGRAVFSDSLINDMIRLMNNMFLTGFKIAAPVLATILLADIALGILMKTIPQLNIFVVGIPLKMILGLIILVLTIPLFISIVDVLINGMNSEILNFLMHMAEP